MGYADELFDLTDRVVLVTGGSRGLGREMAFAAARCGADVSSRAANTNLAWRPPTNRCRDRPRRVALPGARRAVG